MDNVISIKANSSFELETITQRTMLNSMAMDGPGLTAMVRAADLKVLFVNNQFEHYLGYSNADLAAIDIFFTDILEKYLHDRLMFQLNMIRNDHAARSRYVIYPLKGKGGAVSPFYLYAAPVDNEQEDMYCFVMHPELSKWDMPFTSFTTREIFLEQFNSEDFGTFEWIIDVDKVFWSVGVYRIYEVEDKHFQINRSFADAFIHPNDIDRVNNAMEVAMTTHYGSEEH